MTNRAGLATVAAILLLALGVGTYARFAGLGTWPVATDEFYLSESVRNWDDQGLPAFPRGGIYKRGLLVQLMMLGSTAVFGHTEFAYRLPAALLGLLACIPLWLLAARHLGRVGAAFVVALFLLSSWHVEFARFARMYAALTGVVLLFFYALERGFVDGSARWKTVAAGVAVLCMFVHETQAILAGLFLAFSLPRKGAASGSWPWAGVGLGLLAIAVFWRGMHGAPADLAHLMDPERPGSLLPIRLPDPEALRVVMDGVGLTFLWLATLAVVTFAVLKAGASLALLPALLALVALLPLWGVLLLLVAVFLGFAAGGMRERRTGAPIAAASIGSALCLVAAALSMRDFSLIPRSVDQPNVYWNVVRPWMEVMPLWGGLCFLALGTCVARVLLTGYEPRRDALCIGATFALFAVALIKTRSVSTRYTYFLYPVLVIVLLNEGARLLRLIPRLQPARARLVAFSAVALLFVLSRDFQPSHLLDPGSERANFRLGAFQPLRNHWYQRSDWRQLAEQAQQDLPPGATLLLTHRTLPMLRYYAGGPVRTFLWEGSNIARSTPEGWRDLWLDTQVCYGVPGMVECLRESPPLIAMEIVGRDRNILEESAEIAGRWRFELAFTERSGDIGLFRIVPR